MQDIETPTPASVRRIAPLWGIISRYLPIVLLVGGFVILLIAVRSFYPTNLLLGAASLVLFALAGIRAALNVR